MIKKEKKILINLFLLKYIDPIKPIQIIVKFCKYNLRNTFMNTILLVISK